jgi:hypothetical protein
MNSSSSSISIKDQLADAVLTRNLANLRSLLAQQRRAIKDRDIQEALYKAVWVD